MNITFRKIKDGRLMFPATDRDNITVGELYNFDSLITEGEHAGKNELKFYEYKDPGVAMLIMTNRKGEKPLAATTNDCVRDGFPEKCLATVVVDVGNHILYTYPRFESGVDTKMQNLLIFRVEEISPNVMYSATPTRSISIRLVDRYVTATHHGVNFNKDAVNHILIAGERISNDYCSPKYCFSPGRIVDNRLFAPDSDGRLMSRNVDGTQLIVNDKSPLYEEYRKNYSNGATIFIRCFYSKKHIGSERIYVDGAILPMIDEPGVLDYIQSSTLSNKSAMNIVKKAVTHGGETFYAATTTSGDIRPIYKNAYGYMTILLTDHEETHISEMLDLVM